MLKLFYQVKKREGQIMDFNLSKEQLMIQQMAQEFAEKYIEPVAEKIYRENVIPEEIIKGLAELELFGIPYPEEYGGADGGYDGYVLAMEQIAKASGGVAMTISAHCLALSALSVFATEEQKKRFMTPATAQAIPIPMVPAPKTAILLISINKPPYTILVIQ
jgi:alkylation response protein AidB-like acyl-CoA dehydrogenase